MTLLMLVAMLAVTVFSASSFAAQAAYAEQGGSVVARIQAALDIKPVEEVYVEEDNPLDGEDAVAILKVSASARNIDLKTSLTEYVSREEGIQAIKEAMEAREGTFSFTLATDEGFESYGLEMFYEAFEEDDNPMHGDYLRWVYDTVGVNMGGYVSGSTYYITYTYTVAYKTTAEQERETLAAAKKVLANLEAAGSMNTRQEKIRAIYDYICSHVTYDYDNLNNDSYRLQYTAYGALIDGTSVCQGYASLLYLMARLEGIPVRIIAGYATNSDGQGEGHAWNIVKLGSCYYNVDSTWDAPRYELGLDYEYYLKSDKDFADHKRGTDGSETLNYASSEFYTAYPMASVSYDPSMQIDDDPEEDVHKHVAGPATIENEVAATCTKEGSYDEVVRCETCGEVISTNHVIVDALGHKAGSAKHENVIAATCTADGSYDDIVRCTVCGEAVTKTHVVVEALGHEWDAGRVTTKPGCTTAGVRTYTCARDSSHTYTESIPASGHKAGTAKRENEKAATCTAAGSYDEVVRCTVCGEVVTTNHVTVDALGHKAGTAKRENEVAATCAKEGSYDEVVRCTVCGDVVTSKHAVVPKLDHVPGAAKHENEVAATCTEAGAYDDVVRCTVCGEVVSTNSVAVPALGHAWGAWKTIIEPTESKQGLEQRVCANDTSHIDQRPIPELGHVHKLEAVAEVAATCTTAGAKAHWRCSGCGLLFLDAGGVNQADEEELTIPAAHNPEKESVENNVDATCTEDGSYDEVVRCTVCGEVVTTNHVIVDALGHKTGTAKRENVKAATCTAKGSYDQVSRCTRCNTVVSSKHVETKALGHSWGAWKLVKKPTLTATGLERRVCARNTNPKHVQTRFVAKLVNISKATSSTIKACVYTGKALKPAVNLKYKGKTLKNGTDYTLSYKANVKAGTAVITAKGKGKFGGSKTIKFKINKAAISKASTSKVKTQKLNKTGVAVKPNVTVKFGGKKLKMNRDYTVTYKNNKKKGTAQIAIKGKGNFSGTKIVKFKIA